MPSAQVALYLPLCSICHCLHCGSHNLIFTESFRLPLDETFHKSAQDGCRVLGPGHDCAGTQAPWDPTPRTHARHRNLDPRRDKNEPLAGMKVELCRNRIMHTTNTYVNNSNLRHVFSALRFLQVHMSLGCWTSIMAFL